MKSNADIDMTKAMEPMIDSDYAIDDPSKGWDCLNSLKQFYENQGVKLPEYFEGWTWDNYGKRAVENPTKAHQAFERFAETLGKEVDINYMLPGDLLLFAIKDLGTYAGIYLGAGNAFMMFDKGGRVCPMAFFRPFVKSVRRLIE